MGQVAAMHGHDVNLWGTWLDDAFISAVEEGRDHPRLRLRLHPRIKPMRSDALAAALEGAELVIHGVSSEGAVAVMSKAAQHLPDAPILSVTKGFLPGASGRMIRIDEIVGETVARATDGRKRVRFVHAAGPAKAIEIARSVLTMMFFASERAEDAKLCAEAMGADFMRIATSTDVAGAEICSATKNAYATGLGIWDGLLGADCHNARAACFQQAAFEMARMSAAGGGKPETAYHAPGIGDLHVTAAAGRNRGFGEGIGKGKPAREVAAEMLAAGNLTEGYPAIASAWRWAKEHGIREDELPLLGALHAIVWEDAPVKDVVQKLRFTL